MTIMFIDGDKPIITKEMEEEEKIMAEENAKEEKRVREQYKEVSKILNICVKMFIKF